MEQNTLALCCVAACVLCSVFQPCHRPGTRDEGSVDNTHKQLKLFDELHIQLRPIPQRIKLKLLFFIINLPLHTARACECSH